MKCSNPNCSNLNIEFEEKLIHESHDVPCYIFPGKGRNEKKSQADKFGRRWLCLECHDSYENKLRLIFIKSAQAFAESHFTKKIKEEQNDTKAIAS